MTMTAKFGLFLMILLTVFGAIVIAMAPNAMASGNHGPRSPVFPNLEVIEQQMRDAADRLGDAESRIRRFQVGFEQAEQDANEGIGTVGAAGAAMSSIDFVNSNAPLHIGVGWGTFNNENAFAGAVGVNAGNGLFFRGTAFVNERGQVGGGLGGSLALPIGD